MTVVPSHLDTVPLFLDRRRVLCCWNDRDRTGSRAMGKHDTKVLRGKASHRHMIDPAKLAEGMLRELETNDACCTRTLDGQSNLSRSTSNLNDQGELQRNEDRFPQSLNEQILDQLSPETDTATYALLLRLCTDAKALPEGRRVHQHMTLRGYACNRFLSNLLVQMYSYCGSLEDARNVFQNTVTRNIYSWNIMITACVQNGHCKEALELYGQFQAEGITPNTITLICVLNACASMAALEDSREIHSTIVGIGLESEVVVGNALVTTYGKCWSLDNSRAVFAEMPMWDVVSWNAMIAAYAQNLHAKEALQLFSQMQAKGMKPDDITFVSVLDSCVNVTAMEEGQEIHAAIVGKGWELDVVVATALTNMYGKCGNMDDSRTMFLGMPLHNMVSWNAMIAACAQNGHHKEALQLFGQMQTEGIRPSKITFICVLNDCASVAALEEGREIHATSVGSGWEGDLMVVTALIDMYGKCQSLDDSRSVFAEMAMQNVGSWTAMIAVCTQNGHCKEALQILGQMQTKGIQPNQVTFICSLDACASMIALAEGQEIHATVLGNRSEVDVFVGNALINMYGKCGNLDDSRAVFAAMMHRDVVSWNAMITACAENGDIKEALQLLGEMHAAGVKPNEITFMSVLDVCDDVVSLKEGREIHATIIGNGLALLVVENALVHMYGKCGSLDDSRAVFADMALQDVVSWNTMITAYAQNSHGKEALHLFGQMQAGDVKPDMITVVCVLDACASVTALEEGQAIHATTIGNEWESHVVMGNALSNMYSKCGSLDDSRAVFAEMPLQDRVSWNAMIGACVQNGHDKEAIQLFGEMQTKSIAPDKITFICVLNACASLAALEEGQEIHATIFGTQWQLDFIMGNALVNMYGKCGSLDDSGAVFAQVPLRDLVSWNAMIAVCAQNGYGKEALQLFGQMQTVGVEPDKITFICVLNACSHAGLVADGRQYFASMIRDHGIAPSVEHYVCMIDLFGRQGLLEEAENLTMSMPFEHVSSAWLSLLSSCRIHYDLERAERAAFFVFELDPKSASPYVLLENVYSNICG